MRWRTALNLEDNISRLEIMLICLYVYNMVQSYTISRLEIMLICLYVYNMVQSYTMIL